MNLVATAPLWVLAILALLLIAAAAEDAIRLKISNVTSVCVLALAIAAMAVAGFPAALWQNAVVFALFLVGGTLIFAAGKMGGGDVKLFAALGAWVNLNGALWLLTSVFLAGGILAIGFILVRLVRGGRRKREERGGIPYGVAIVAGAALTFASQRGLF